MKVDFTKDALNKSPTMKTGFLAATLFRERLTREGLKRSTAKVLNALQLTLANKTGRKNDNPN